MDALEISLTAIVLLSIAVSHLLLRHLLSSYASEKGKNLATKEDISDITRLIESTKIAIQQADRYEAKKYELKYRACLKALSIVDAQLSHIVATDNNRQATKIDKQFATAEEIRTCHNELILSVDDAKIIDTFISILTGSSTNAIEDLDKLRGLIRSELGFTGTTHLDLERTWIGKSVIRAEA